MKTFYTAAVAFLACASTARAIDIDTTTATTLAITHAFQEDDNIVTGPNRDGSFLTPGWRTTDSLGLLFNTKRDGTNWESALDGRATDDPRTDVKRFNLKRFYVKRQGEKTTATVGDVYASFSPYTLDHALKGAHAVVNLPQGLQATVAAGTDKSNWDDLWNYSTSESVDRQVYGARLAKNWDSGAALGVSGVLTKDEQSRFATPSELIDERIGGVDYTLPTFHKLTISGESAYSLSDHRNPGTDANGEKIYDATSQSGWAHVIRANYSYGKFKTSDEFESVDKLFATTEGASSPDLLRVKTANTLTISGPWKWIVLNYSYFHNNITHSDLTPTTTTRMPETGLRFEGPDWRPDFSIESKYRYRVVTNSVSGLIKKTNGVVNSVEDRIGRVKLNIDYEYQHEDASDLTLNANHHIFGAGAESFVEPAKDWRIAGSLRYDLQRDRDNLLANTDQTTTIKANATIKTPWAVDGGATFSRGLVLNATSPGNDRRSLQASLGYNILRKDDHRVELHFKQNDNRFDNSTQDYKETTWELTLNDKF